MIKCTLTHFHSKSLLTPQQKQDNFLSPAKKATADANNNKPKTLSISSISTETAQICANKTTKESVSVRFETLISLYALHFHV